MLILLFSDTNYIRDGFVAEYYITNCPKNCTSHGKCVNHRCQCDQLWAGPACDFHLCPNLCGEAESRGVCQNLAKAPHCLCKNGYSGESCNLPASNAGTYGNKWYQLTDENSKLSARAGHAGVYLPVYDRLFIFGGYVNNFVF